MSEKHRNYNALGVRLTLESLTSTQRKTIGRFGPLGRLGRLGPYAEKCTSGRTPLSSPV